MIINNVLHVLTLFKLTQRIKIFVIWIQCKSSNEINRFFFLLKLVFLFTISGNKLPDYWGCPSCVFLKLNLWHNDLVLQHRPTVCTDSISSSWVLVNFCTTTVGANTSAWHCGCWGNEASQDKKENKKYTDIIQEMHFLNTNIHTWWEKKI